MSRRVHFNTPGHAHELTFSCYQSRPFLLDQTHCRYLAEAVSKSWQKHSFKLWAYVFMPNHVHLIIYPTSNSYNIAEILQSIKQSVSRRALINTRESRPILLELFSTGSKTRAYRFWQAGGGYDRNIVSGVALMNAIDYIHNNPVRAGLVKSAEEWKWSSFRDWANLKCGPIAIDGEDIPLT